MKDMKSMMPMVVMVLIAVIGIVYVAQGMSMHSQVSVREAEFHTLLENYFANAKAIRDAAESGTQLTTDLAEIQKFPSELLMLKLVGVGKMLTGIFVLLFGILIALVMMPMRLGQIIKKQASM